MSAVLLSRFVRDLSFRARSKGLSRAAMPISLNFGKVPARNIWPDHPNAGMPIPS